MQPTNTLIEKKVARRSQQLRNVETYSKEFTSLDEQPSSYCMRQHHESMRDARFEIQVVKQEIMQGSNDR